MENYYRELVCFLNARLGNRQAAEDVVHDAYVRVLERASDTPIEQPRAFLYRTALNLVIDGHRRNTLRQVESLEVLDSEERFFTPSPHSSLDHGQRLDMLQRALAELPPLCRELPAAQARRPVPPANRRAPGHFPGTGGKTHRQRHEALPRSRAAVGRALICPRRSPRGKFFSLSSFLSTHDLLAP